MMPTDALCALIREAPEVAIIAHVSPDGDALGSALALMLGLERLGKRAFVYCDDAVPMLYRFMPGWERVLQPDKAQAPLALPLAIAVDVADRGRLGTCAAIFDAAVRTAVVDHHGTNPGYGQVNWIEAGATATACLVYELLIALGIAPDAAMATCVYVGISTDTGHFSHRNLTPEAMRVAAACLECGVDSAMVSEKLYRVRSLSKTRLLCLALESLTMLHGGRVSAMRLTLADFELAGATADETESVIDYGIAVEGTLAAFLAVERPEGIKFSLRARPPVDVGAVCGALGGGGHTLAAGCTLEGTMDEAVARVIAALEKQLHEITLI